MASEKFQIDLDELHRGLACAALIALSVAFTYKTLDFTVSTVRDGVVKTWTILAARAARTMETLSSPLEDLIMNADELGAANLFERFPYPDELHVYRKQSGIGQWRVTRFMIHGYNFDVLRKIEVSLDGVTLSEEADVEPPPIRDAEKYEWQPKTVLNLTTTPLKAIVTVVGSASRWRHQLTVKCEDEIDDSILASRKKPPVGSTPTPTRPAGGTPASVASVAPTPTIEPERDDGQKELVALIDGMSMLPQKRRAAYAKAVADEAFKETELGSLLLELHRSKAKSEDINQQMMKLLSARYMTSRRVRGQIAALHTASPSEIKQALEYQGRGELMKQIDVTGSVNDGVHAILGRIHTQPIVVASVQASVAPGDTPASAGPDVPQGSLDEAYFQSIWEQEQKYKDCMAIVDLLQKAYDVDNQDSVTPGPFDMRRLQSKGHLEYVPSCPDGGGGGEFTIDPQSHKVRCTKHGNRALPWPERRQYERHFNEFERARILVRKQNRVREAIGTLKAYLSRDRGREENNNICQAYLGRLYFDSGNHEAALEVLKRLADKYQKSVRLAYQTSLCFYVRQNEQLALDYAKQALRPANNEFDRIFDEESTPYDLYLLRDECRWMIQNLAPERVLANGERRILPPVRYADFAIKTKPASHAKVCYENLARLRDMVAKVIRGVRGKKEFQGRYTVQETQKESLAKMPDYEKTPRIRTREALIYARRQLRDMSLEILKDAKLSNDNFTPCPSRGVFHLTNTKHLMVDCTEHPNILPAERIDISPAVTDRDARMGDLVLQHAMMAMSPPLEACVERQRRILEQFQNDVLEVVIPPEANLAELEAGGRIAKGTLKPNPDETYLLEGDGDKRTLVCTQHYSLQRLAELQDGVNLIEQGKSVGE